MMEGSVMEVVNLQAGDGIQPGPDRSDQGILFPRLPMTMLLEGGRSCRLSAQGWAHRQVGWLGLSTDDPGPRAAAAEAGVLSPRSDPHGSGPRGAD